MRELGPTPQRQSGRQFVVTPEGVAAELPAKRPTPGPHEATEHDLAPPPLAKAKEDERVAIERYWRIAGMIARRAQWPLPVPLGRR